MNHILRIASGVNVMQLALQLKRNPQLWNRHRERTEQYTTPHKEISDIWVRYAATAAEGKREHDSVWYDCVDQIPAVKELAFGVMGLVQGERLGGILITKVPPGGEVRPHTDTGWHAEYYSKFAVQIESHQQQAFCYEDGELATAPGDVYWFHNQKEHWVVNRSPVDRITLILAIKTGAAGLN